MSGSADLLKPMSLFVRLFVLLGNFESHTLSHGAGASEV